MKCHNCHVKRARPRDLFCSNRCGHAYALELLATTDDRVCPVCRTLVFVPSMGDQHCDFCGHDLSEAPTAFDRVHGFVTP